MSSNALTAIIGHTGFVGSNLLATRNFDHTYNSSNIDEIKGRRFGEVICSAAPAVMWAANKDPQGDRANIERLIMSLKGAEIDRLILISTVAVFDDLSAGYEESSARFKEEPGYGKNRRDLEVEALGSFPEVHVVRLPALFGPGLKKNFIFDLLNPEPSFINSAKFAKLRETFSSDAETALVKAYKYDSGLDMWRYERETFSRTDVGRALISAFEAEASLSKYFTNSQSEYQFYDVRNLSADIDRIVSAGIETMNICSPPISAADIHFRLTGETFANHAPSIVKENVRTEHAATFGGTQNYLYDKETVLASLVNFYKQRTSPS